MFYLTLNIVAVSLLQNLTFDERAEISGKSYDSSILLLSFIDNHIMMTHVLHTTIEVMRIEFHPDRPNLLFGGWISGQIIVWDLTDDSTKMLVGDDMPADVDMDNEETKAEKKEVEDEQKKEEKDEEEMQDKAIQSLIELKPAVTSMVANSHKSFVSDIKFVPKGIKVDKKRPSEGETTHFVTCAEDGIVMIWDSRPVFKENRKTNAEEIHWKPFLSIPLFKTDGTGELGLSRILFMRNSTNPQFWAGSDEGDLIFIDWSKRPTGKEDDQSKIADFMVARESQRNYRQVLALEQSPDFEDLIMTVHDYNFCIWKIDLADYENPIFISSYTFGAYNTWGVFSPTRPGVIFISKTNGIDVWDLVDQSHKASMSFGTLTTRITFLTFQKWKPRDNNQYLAYGEDNAGTIFLYAVPPNLRYPQGDEKSTMHKFF